MHKLMILFLTLTFFVIFVTDVIASPNGNSAMIIKEFLNLI